MTIQKWLKEEKMRLGRFKICCVNAQKKEAKSFPLKMPRSCWSGQYRTWEDSLDGLRFDCQNGNRKENANAGPRSQLIRNNNTLTFDQQGVHIPTK
jgi:hypothetical protein